MTRDELLDLCNSDQLVSILPEVFALKGVPQPPEYHAEGDVFVHTLLALKALSPWADERMVWGVALHDLGKAEKTRFFDGRWRAWGHDRLSATLAAQVLIRFDREDLVADVVWLVKNHHFASSWQYAGTGRLSLRQRRFCADARFHLLVELCRADAAGCRGVSRKKEQLELILQAWQQEQEGDKEI